MKTILLLDDDVLSAAKNLADRERRAVGEVLSSLARPTLRREAESGYTRNGIRLLPAKESPTPVTPNTVKQLRDELPG